MSIEVSKPKTAILASGGGTTAEAFIHATQDGRVPVTDVDLIVCSQPSNVAGVYKRAEALNRQYGLDIDVVHISGITHPKGVQGRGQTDEESTAIRDLLRDRGIDHVALMGYMRIVRGPLLDEYGYHPGQNKYDARMTNTHPGPLPETRDTYGDGASAKVLSLGMEVSRHTVHLVAAGVDTGPILAEHPVEVKEGDDPQRLFERVQVVEKAALPYAINEFLNRQMAHRFSVEVSAQSD